MISVSDASSFAEESPSISRFKPWWEVVIDYIILALLLMTLVAWSGVIAVEASGLVCIPKNRTNIQDFGFVESRYTNSRCSQEFEARALLYYPYILFLQWLILFLIQRTWLKIPAVVTKLDAFHNIFSELCTITPKFGRTPHTMQLLPGLDYSEENKDKIKVQQDKLLFLIRDRSSLVRIYTAKVTVLFILTLLGLCGMVLWLSITEFKLADFPCTLYATRKNVDYVCNFAPAYFLYALMVGNSLLLLLVLLLCGRSIYWLFSHKGFSDDAMFDTTKDNYVGLPGFRDLKFCMSLLRRNVRDGRITFEVLKFCLRGQACHKKESVAKSKREDYGPARDVRNFQEEHVVVRWMAKELGLELVPNNQTSNHLFECLDYIWNGLNDFDLDFTVPLRQKLADEIQRNPHHFLSMIDQDPDVPDFVKFVQIMRDEETFGRQYALAAAANVFNVRLVVIHCQSSNSIKETFEPYTAQSFVARCTRFLTFVSPYYYHATKISPCSGAEVEHFEDKRMRFATDDMYRNHIRQSGIRSLIHPLFGSDNAAVKSQQPSGSDKISTEMFPSTALRETIPKASIPALLMKGMERRKPHGKDVADMIDSPQEMYESAHLLQHRSVSLGKMV